MKLTLDTDRKVIEIDEAVNIAELIEELKTLFGKEWRAYSIEQRITWSYPYVPYIPPTYIQPFWTGTALYY